LSGDVEIELVNEPVGDVFEDTRGEVVLSKDFLIAFEGASANLGARLEIESVLDVGSK
jgi:hypothetical protein